ncbi:MMB_0454 family protein [Mesoplasma photuris]|uniref:MMB_0454 family protein n=1 Tax=Mesoplasma photuris TaxID=217731 RepID=UPI0004E0D579|nr:hypothetical protein [Mesoplasma photuris]
MYISIERNSRGALDIEQYALNKLIQSAAFNAIGNNAVNIEVITDIYHDNLLYVLVKVVLDTKKEFVFEEAKIMKNIEQVITQTLNIKPRNIAVAYSR